jgi:uncharacterized protein (TIGR00251 family)
VIRFTEKDGAIIFTVRVVPRTAKSEIAGTLEGALKVRINAPPIDGAANAELVKFLAKTLGVAKREVEIIKGQTSKTKQVKISNAAREKLSEIVNLK